MSLVKVNLRVELYRKGMMEGHVKYRMRLGKLRLRRLFPVLRLDSGVDLNTRVKILRMIAHPTAFYRKQVAVHAPEGIQSQGNIRGC